MTTSGYMLLLFVAALALIALGLWRREVRRSELAELAKPKPAWKKQRRTLDGRFGSKIER